ncbi:MAG: archease [Nanoarchaeota archaeon]
MKYKFLEHTGDIKFQAYGKTLNEVFENSVIAVSTYISRGKKIKSSKGKVIDVSGTDIESLFYNFLDEIIYLFDAENFIAAKAKITIRGNNLHAEFFGDDASNYKDLDQIKAATYAEMYIKKKASGWEAQAVLDV